MTMGEVMERLKLNKFSLFLTLIVAAFAAFSTLFFALFEGIKNLTTILFRVFISFAFFSVVGYFISSYLENECFKMLTDSTKNEVLNKIGINELDTDSMEKTLTGQGTDVIDSEN